MSNLVKVKIVIIDGTSGVSEEGDGKGRQGPPTLKLRRAGPPSRLQRPSIHLPLRRSHHRQDRRTVDGNRFRR